MLDQEVIVIDEFKGLYDRGELRDQNVTQISPGFFKTLDNFYHQGESLVSRPGYAPLGLFSGDTLLRLWPYRKPSDATDRFIVFYQSGANTNIKDSGGGTGLNLGTVGHDFQLFILRDKAIGGDIFVHPALQQPLGFGNLRIYRLDGLPFRDAAGISPAPGVPIVAVTGAAGKVETGVHLIAVAYETDTGFITPPGPFIATIYSPTVYTAPGGAAINLTIIPLGPAGTVARHILVSKVIRPPFNGDVLVPELFFAPGGKISDNTTTILTGLSFYDSELVNSADYLLDELEVIPSGVCYCIYRNRLIIVGFPPTAAAPAVGGINTIPSYIARVSNPGAYESFSAIEGFIQVAINDGDALQACWEQNGNLYIAKGNRTYVTRDNGGPPNTWEVNLVDAAIGCGPWGVAKVDNSQNSLVEGGTIIGSRRGIYFFTGQYSTFPLTYNIEAIYRREVAAMPFYSSFFSSKFYYDSYRRLLYCLLGGSVTGTISTSLLVGACDNGLNPEKVRWSKFNNFSNTAGSTTARGIIDIYTPTPASSINYLDTMLFMIFDSATVDIAAIRTTMSLDEQTASGGGRINWSLVSFPAEVDELDKLQVVGARALIKHDNPDDPIDFNFRAFDYTYGEFTPEVLQFLGDREFPPKREMTIIPQLYDVPINLRSKLIGIVLSRGIRGGAITSAVSFGSITNSVFIHRLMIFGNKVAQGKAQGSIR